MMKSSKSLISVAESSARGLPERFRGAVLGNVLEPQGAQVGERRLQADGPCPLGLLKQTIEHDEIVVERLDLDPFGSRKVVRIVALRFELGRMKAPRPAS